MSDDEEAQIYKKRYTVQRKLGIRSSGVTYLVSDANSNDELKTLKVVRLGEIDPQVVNNGVHEAGLLSSIDHEHIVKFHESFLENDCLCIVTEFCEGGDLEQRLKELKKNDQKLQEGQVVEWLVQILIAVQYMHKSRILHRDLKARNIFLKNNQVKIGDFGISRILVGTMDVTMTSADVPCSMPPEVLQNGIFEAKSDIWFVGCLLYEMCTYQHAFDVKGLMNVVHEVVEGKPPNLPVLYSKELNDVLKSMWTKDPTARPTAGQLLKRPHLARQVELLKASGSVSNIAKNPLARKKVNFHQRDLKDENPQQESNESTPDRKASPVGGIRATVIKSPLIEQHEVEEESAQKLARQSIIERKIKEADSRGQLFVQAIRSNSEEADRNRRKLGQSAGSPVYFVRPVESKPSSSKDPEKKPLTPTKLPKTINNELDQHSSESSRFVWRANNRLTFRNGIATQGKKDDDRPISPLRSSYQQIASLFDDDSDNLRLDVSSSSFMSIPTVTGSPGKKQHPSALSQSITGNPVRRTIDAQYPADFHRLTKYPSVSRTIVTVAKPKNALQTPSTDTRHVLEKDSVSHLSSGPLGRYIKINQLRTRAILTLGEESFHKVYEYLKKQRVAQRTDPTLDDTKVKQGLIGIGENPRDCFLVEQLVFLETL